MLKQVHPPIKHCLQLPDTLLKASKFQKNKPQYIGHNLIGPILPQTIRGMVLLSWPIIIMLKLKIQDGHNSHRSEIIIPVELNINMLGSSLLPQILVVSHTALLTDWIRGVVNCPLTEMLLITFLHLDDKCSSIHTTTGNIKDHLTIILSHSQMLCRDKIHILNLNILQKNIEKTNQHILVGFTSKQSLKHKITQKLCILLPSRSLHFPYI